MISSKVVDLILLLIANSLPMMAFYSIEVPYSILDLKLPWMKCHGIVSCFMMLTYYLRIQRTSTNVEIKYKFVHF